MNKEQILKMSQKENSGKLDEREIIALDKASRVGMVVGAFICIALVLVSRYILNTPELAFAGFMLYFALQGSSNLALYKSLKSKTKLIYGIVEIIFSVAFAVAIVIKTVA